MIHDCMPLNARMTTRSHQHGPAEESDETRAFWTGDVWRIIPILREFRPDLEVMLIDCPPTGLVICRNLDPRSTRLMFSYEKIVEKYSSLLMEDYGLGRIWSTFPYLSSRKILEDPRLFCELIGFRA